jgi:hypothetical protein
MVLECISMLELRIYPWLQSWNLVEIQNQAMPAFQLAQSACWPRMNRAMSIASGRPAATPK